MLKFRMLVLQAMHALSLEQTEYLLRDRLSWMRFCGLGPGDATFVAAPRQPDTDGEKAAIRAGLRAAAIWPEKPAKARQKCLPPRRRGMWTRAGR